MRLSDLEPRWYRVPVQDCSDETVRVGFTFNCPHCTGSAQRLAVPVHQDGLVNPHPDDNNCLHLGHVWEMTGGESWDTLTLTPSVDASATGHWHGFITNGEIR